MATHVVYGAISNMKEGMPTFSGDSVAGGESMSESGTSAQSTASITKTTGRKQQTWAWRVSAIGAAIYVTVGENPTASVSAGVYVPVGATEWIVGTEGDKVAIITA